MEQWTAVWVMFSVICQSLFNRMPCLEACRLNTQCPPFPPTLWFSCELMNLITFVSACCCVQKGLFGTLGSMWEGLYSCYIPVFGLVFELSHHYEHIYQLTAQTMLSDVLTECWYFVPLGSDCEISKSILEHH